MPIDIVAPEERYLDLLKKSLTNLLYLENEARLIYILLAVVAERKAIDALAMRLESIQAAGMETTSFDAIKVYRNNGRIRYEGIVHNNLVGYKKPGASLGRIIHYGYDQGPEAARKKFERTATLLRKQIEENPENAAAHMYLSCSHAVLEQHEEALCEAMIGVDLLEAQQITNKQYREGPLRRGAIRTLILASRYGEAEALCRKAQSRFGIRSTFSPSRR